MKHLVLTFRFAIAAISIMVVLLVMMTVVLLNPGFVEAIESIRTARNNQPEWIPPEPTTIPASEEGALIRYGEQLVIRTSTLIGPRGSVAHVTNGMNCQNCHLSGGKKKFGNNFSAVASTYPKFRPRSGAVETIEKRVNDCVERSLNGKPLDENSREMKAYVAYIRWLGKDVPLKTVPPGAGIVDLEFLERAADPVGGSTAYQLKCSRCHGVSGEGVRENALTWKYPPLWGPESFNVGAGLFRISRMAGYLKMNMPQDGAKALTEEEAWDVAAYVLSMPRPEKEFPGDWPDLKKKPFDCASGPYADGFSAKQHRLGPFGPIAEAYKKK